MIEADPWPRMLRWLDEAHGRFGRTGWTVCLANCDAQGRPTARMVSLRGIDREARDLFVYINYLARKGVGTDERRPAALCFYWPELSRQLRVEGSMVRASRENSRRYFASRARGHQASVIVSRQGRVLQARPVLEAAHARTQAQPQPLECPEDWGGLRFSFEQVEFWRSGADRLHHRDCHERDTQGVWRTFMVQP